MSTRTPRQLILHSTERPRCARLARLFGKRFESQVVGSAEELSDRVRTSRVDAGVLCSCSAREDSVAELLHVVALVGPVPVLVCCRTYNPGFIHLAASAGVTHFLLCGMAEEVLREYVSRVIRQGGLRELLHTVRSQGPRLSPHIARLGDHIAEAFPRRPTATEVSRRLGVSPRRLQSLCREAFGRPFTQLLRLIWVHQALVMMRNTSFDNTEIAIRLAYEDESSLARIFRKQLGYSPSEARRRLAGQSPGELLDLRAPHPRPGDA